jgi:hypothetical protein
MYKEIKKLPKYFLVEEAWLGCSEKNQFSYRMEKLESYEPSIERKQGKQRKH